MMGKPRLRDYLSLRGLGIALEAVAYAILRFPIYTLEYVLGFYAVLNDVEMTTLAIVAVLLGFQVGIAWALIGVLAFWVLLRTLSRP